MDKEIYSFDVKLPEMETKDGGEKKEPIRVVIKKPSKRMIEEAAMYKAVKMSECIKRGVLTKNMLATKYANEGGVLTKQEAEDHVAKYRELADLETKWANLELTNGEKKITKTMTKKLSDILYQMNKIRREIAQTESSYSHLFENTADVIAQREEVKFLVLMLTYLQKEDDGETKMIPFFDGETFEEREKDYYKKDEEEDDLYLTISAKCSYIISFWRTGAAQSKEDFEKLEKDLK
jgi:hypothetical protein